MKKLVGNQSKLDLNKNGKLDSNDFKMLRSGKKMAKGGHVSKGEMVWNKLSSSDKIKFLYENFTPEITPRSQETLVGKSYNFLPKNVKIKMEAKYANVENYGNGGGTGVSSETGYAEGTNASLLMNQDYLAYEKGGSLADTPESFPSNDAVSYKTGGEVEGMELMGGQPNSSKPSGYFLLEVKNKGREIIVSDDGGKTKERYVKNNGFSGYTVHYKGNKYEFTDSYANGGSTKGFEYTIGGL